MSVHRTINLLVQASAKNGFNAVTGIVNRMFINMTFSLYITCHSLNVHNYRYIGDTQLKFNKEQDFGIVTTLH